LLTPSQIGCRCGPLGSGGEPDLVVPAEVADAQSLELLSDWSALPVLGAGRYQEQSSEDRETGEQAPNPLWSKGNRDMNNFICASANADPSAQGTRFVLDRPSCPEPYAQGYVLARFEGSGRLSRLWLTAASIRRRPAQREILRIYVDDASSPLIQAPLAKVLDGSAGEFFGRPFGAGSSKRMAWYYPVVFSSKLVVTLDRLDPRDLYYYQASAVLDATAAPRRAPKERLARRDRALALLGAGAPAGGTVETKRLVLEPGETVAALDRVGPATIVQTRVKVARARLRDLANVGLVAHWDNAAEPAMNLPLSMLFGATDAVPELSSLALGAMADGGDIELSLRLPMPYARRAQWSVRNEGASPLDFELAVETIPTVPSGRWGELQAQSYETTLPLAGAHPLASARGPGRLVGVCMSLAGHGGMRGGASHPMTFLEGDERGIVDGRRAMRGTGTEDYFNGAFYFEEGASAGPFAQVWAIDPGERTGHASVSACRWHVLGDAIDFDSSLELEMEIGPGNPDVIDRYRSVAFLYLSPAPERAAP